MRSFRTFMVWIGVLVFVGFGFYIVSSYYSWIFSHTVEGQIYQVERVTDPTMIVGSTAVRASAMYSFAVAIRGYDGTIYTASSEDRQWAIPAAMPRDRIERGVCVKAKFYPYPPWDLDKAGTYSNARLIALSDCPKNRTNLPPLPEPAPAINTAPAGSAAPNHNAVPAPEATPAPSDAPATDSAPH